MAEPGHDSGPAGVRRRAPRRLWSLPAAQAQLSHGASDEVCAIARTVAELGWLLLLLVLAYAALARRSLPGGATAAILGGSLVFAAALIALHTLAPIPARGQWPMLGRCWAMAAYITWVIVQAAPDRWPLANLYHLVIIASAAALGARATVLNLALIAAALALIWSATGPAAGAGPELSLILGPMALIAYVTARLTADIRSAIERIRFIAETDELTRLYNLRAFMHLAERLHRQAKRYSRPYALVMIDSDNLKAVNDAHGHQTGNELLKRTTACIRRELRETDVAARYGGDEFILLLPETSAQGARELSERIRRSVADRGMEVRGLRIATSVSVGIAAFPDHGTDLRSIMNKADQAMYLSKKTGRNRVTVFDPG
ncbi:MAG: GGDEF domain-containing protein [Burkholderiales bacterium]